MACKVKYNEDNSIRRVIDEQGNTSRLFQDIINIPILQTAEEALETYKNRYSSKFMKEPKAVYAERKVEGDSVFLLINPDGTKEVVPKPEGVEIILEEQVTEDMFKAEPIDEPVLIFRSDRGKLFSSYSDALSNSNGGNISIHMGSPVNEPIITVSSNTNPSTTQGFINYVIKNDLLSSKRLLDEGKLYFLPKGERSLAQVVNAAVIENEARPNLGTASIKVHQDRKIEIFDEKGKITIGDKPYTFEELDGMSFMEMVDEFGREEAQDIIINRDIKREVRTTRGEDNTLKYTEPELAQKFLDLLSKMGVSVKSISDYIDSYKIRNGVEPSAAALADIANQVVAFKDGVINIEDLAEETAHFIVEAWDNQEIENLLRNIHKTSQWKQYSNYYKDIYTNQGFEGDALDNMVRKEILGKVLADNLVEKFSAENKTEVEQNIAQRILQLFRDFILKVENLFKAKTELENFTEEVQKVLDSKDAENLLSTETFASKHFTMYSANKKAKPTAEKLNLYVTNLIESLLDQERSLLKADRGLKSNITKLRELQQDTTVAMTTKSILDLVKSAERQVSYIKEATKKSKKDGGLLTNEENVVLNSLKNILKPTLSDLKTVYSKINLPSNTQTKEAVEKRRTEIISTIDRVLLEIESAESDVRTTDTDLMDGIIDRIVERYNLPEEYRERVEQALKAADKDTSAFYATFGQLTSASDALLNLAGSKILDTQLEATQAYVRRSKEFAKTLEELGMKPGDLKQFYDKNGFILGQVDWSSFDKKIQEIEAQALIDATDTNLSVEKIIEMKRNPNKFPKESLPLLETDEQRATYSSTLREKKAPLVESIFKDEYYDEKENKYRNYNISEAAKRELKYLSLDRGTLMSRVKMENGYPRYTNQNKIDLQEIAQQRKSLKNIRDREGNVKEGLIVSKTAQPDNVSINNPNFFIFNGYRYSLAENASEDAQIAFDINKLDAVFQLQEGGTQLDFDGLSENFMKQLQLIEQNEGREEALEFFRLNATVTFSQDFWNSLGDTKNFEDRVIDYLENNPEDKGTVEAYRNFVEASEKRKAILKNYKDPKNTSNILVENMYSETQESVRDLTESIELYYRQIFSKLPEQKTDADKREVITERDLNQSYYDYIKDNRLITTDQKFDFTLEHVPASKRAKISEVKQAVDSYFKNEKKFPVSEKIAEKIANLYPGEGVTFKSLSTKQIKNAPLLLAQQSIAPYYRAFAPQGFRQIYDRLTDSKESVTDVVREMDTMPSLKITNEFAYYDTDTNKYKNPRFKEESDTGRYQPKMNLEKVGEGRYKVGKDSMFVNAKFQNMFDPTYNEKGDVVSVGRNEKLYEGYKVMLDFQRENLKAINEYGNTNLYQAPQMSRTTLDKIVNLVNKKDKQKTAREFIKDIVSYRTDELAEGVERGGKSVFKMTGMRFIPKYYINKLEESSDVSDDLFYSMTTMAQQSELYKSRKKHYAEIMAIEEALLTRNYPDGKEPESTNTMKMFRSFIDNNIFGIVEQTTMKANLPIIGQVDIAKVARFLHKWLRLRNLGYNFIIPLTSWATGEATYFVETLIGDYVNRHSTGRARTEMRKHSTSAIKESLEVNSKSRLNLIGEHYDFFNIAERFKDSKYGKIMRKAPGMGMALHTAANFPINTRVAINSLINHRFVKIDGKVDILNYNEFKAKSPKMSNKQLRANWKQYENDTFYDAIDTSNGVVDFNYGKIAEKMGRENNEEFREYFKNKEQGIAARTLKIIERVDTQIRPEERSAATRHFMLNFLTTHRNYLWLQYAYRFKNKHINIQTGRAEEGTYRSLANFFVRNFNKGAQNKFKGFFKQVKEDYLNAENQTERDNIKRTLIEIGALQVLVGIGFLISAMADDEDNKDIYGLQLTAYEMDRVVKEMTSAYTGTIPEFYDAVKSPIIGMDFLKDVFSVHKFFDSEIIGQGKYGDLTKNQRHALKLIPGIKNIHDIYDADNIRATRNVYRRYNQDAVETMNPIYWLLNSE